MSGSKRELPGTVRWARRLCVLFGVLLALTAAGLLLALVVLPPELASRRGRLWPYGVVYAFGAWGLLWAAVGIRERSRGAWRAGVGSYAGLVAVDLAGGVGRSRFGLNTLLMLIGLCTLLAPPTRRWFDATEEDLRLADEEDRRIRLARRRLSEEAPSLWDISLRDLPRRDHR